mmetsp:Transcript_102112/g.255879  ORF Transcript_102112/g.255879 Transcript_102112/m.255879 type:complete len:228 (-) Transcript_102112:223-906(-)
MPANLSWRSSRSSSKPIFCLRDLSNASVKFSLITAFARNFATLASSSSLSSLATMALCLVLSKAACISASSWPVFWATLAMTLSINSRFSSSSWPMTLAGRTIAGTEAEAGAELLLDAPRPKVVALLLPKWLPLPLPPPPLMPLSTLLELPLPNSLSIAALLASLMAMSSVSNIGWSGARGSTRPELLLAAAPSCCHKACTLRYTARAELVVPSLAALEPTSLVFST